MKIMAWLRSLFSRNVQEARIADPGFIGFVNVLNFDKDRTSDWQLARTACLRFANYLETGHPDHASRSGWAVREQAKSDPQCQRLIVRLREVALPPHREGDTIPGLCPECRQFWLRDYCFMPCCPFCGLPKPHMAGKTAEECGFPQNPVPPATADT